MPYAHLPESVVAIWPRLSPKAKAVIVALAAHMNGLGECWPSVKALAEMAGLGREYSVSLALRELRDAGLVKTTRRGQHQTQLYAWADPAENAETDPPQNPWKARVLEALHPAESADSEPTQTPRSSRDLNDSDPANSADSKSRTREKRELEPAKNGAQTPRIPRGPIEHSQEHSQEHHTRNFHDDEHADGAAANGAAADGDLVAIEDNGNGTASAEVETEPPPPPKKQTLRVSQDDLNRVRNRWNDKAPPNLPRIQTVNGTRAKHLKARIKDAGGLDPLLANLDTIISKIRASAFLCGQAGRDSWTGATFDWVLKPTNWTKILEGNYDRKTGGVDPDAKRGY